MFRKLVMTVMVVTYCSPAQMFASAGTLDATFNPSGTPPGTVFTDISNPLTPHQSIINGIAIQPDGKIVATGYSLLANSSFALARYNTDGTLDTSFGVGGIVTTPTGTNADFMIGYDVVIQPDGKIVVAGADTFSYNAPAKRVA